MTDATNQEHEQSLTVEKATEVDMSLVWLDPAELKAHPANVRTDQGDVAGLAESIRQVGVQTPLKVTPADGGYRIIDGHRRSVAAIEAGVKVPCVVVSAETETDQVLTMLVTPRHRKGLTDAEETTGYAQLAALGMKPIAIAKKTGVKSARVKAALVVADSELGRKAISRYDLTVDQAAALVEFDDDTDAVKALVAATRNDQFDHALSRLRRDREETTARAVIAKELTTAGIPVLDQAPAWWDRKTLMAKISDLAHDGKPLTDKTHATCPGRAAYVENGYRGMHAVELCRSPKEHGHTARNAHTGTGLAGKMTDAEKVERRTVIENNKAWRAAEPVRRKFIRAMIGRATPPKTAQRFVTDVLLRQPDLYASYLSGRLTAELLGIGVSSQDNLDRTVNNKITAEVSKASDRRLPQLLLAHVAAAYEASTANHTWRGAHPETARWLAWLIEQGYTPAPVEQLVIDAQARRTGKKTHLKVAVPASSDDDKQLPDAG